MKGRSGSFAVSGRECVVALCQLGFVVAAREAGHTVLQRRNASIVIVPDELVVPDVALDAILASANISYASLLDAIDDTPTEPELAWPGGRWADQSGPDA